MKKSFALIVSLFTLLSANASTIELDGGDVITINANTQTTVSCAANAGHGGSGEVSCTEGCQKWYDINTVVNGRWQLVPNCAFTRRCEFLSNGCMKQISCAGFATTQSVVNGQWQDVVSCASSQTTTSCR